MMPLPPPDRRPLAIFGAIVGALVVAVFGYAFWRAVNESAELDLVDATPDPEPAPPADPPPEPPAGDPSAMGAADG